MAVMQLRVDNSELASAVRLLKVRPLSRWLNLSHTHRRKLTHARFSASPQCTAWPTCSPHQRDDRVCVLCDSHPCEVLAECVRPSAMLSPRAEAPRPLQLSEAVSSQRLLMAELSTVSADAKDIRSVCVSATLHAYSFRLTSVRVLGCVRIRSPSGQFTSSQ
jgi:hypothetical protein